MNYREFKKDYVQKLGKGKKFNIKELNAAWNEYKKTIDTIPEEKKPTIDSLEIDQQQEMQVSAPSTSEVLITATDQSKNTKINDSVMSEFTIEELQEVAAAFHETIARIVKHATKGRVDLVKDNSLATINKFGGRLLKKYDQSGLLEKYGLEISYGICVVGIALETGLVVQAIKKEGGESSDK